jgi:hypothetical protein
LQCVGGRPLIISGEARIARVTGRTDWLGARERASAAVSSEVQRSALASAWAREASFEHASIASFARFALELMSVGAPSDLVEAAARAMIEETEHARLCYALASRHAGRALGPDRIDLSGSLSVPTLAEIVYATVRDGCVGETIAAMVASTALETTTDEEARHALQVIANDEASHAELAYRFVAFAIGKKDPDVIEAVRRGFADAAVRVASVVVPAPGDEELDRVLEAHGRLSEGKVWEATCRAMREIVEPARDLLLQTA